MDDQIELVDDGDGLAVVGPAAAVERFLRSERLWKLSQKLDRRQIRVLLGKGADLAESASKIAADSARWMKLTPESAALREKFGLTPTDTPGISHAMIGNRGAIESWMQVETGARSLLTNPAALSGVAGIMAQASMQQAIAEIIEYLAMIDEKVDDVLRKQDEAVRAPMAGVESAIDRAMSIRSESGGISDDVWSTLSQAPVVIGTTQNYALDQLDAIAKKLESTRVGALAKTVEAAKSEVPGWLAVLAHCFQLLDATDVIHLERVLADTPEELIPHRLGLEMHREERRDSIAHSTAHLLDRMDAAVGTANAKMIWNRTKALEVVGSANQLASGVHAFHEVLGVECDARAWDARQLGRGAERGSRAIQRTKDDGPKAVAVVGLTATVGIVKSWLQDGEDPEVD